MNRGKFNRLIAPVMGLLLVACSATRYSVAEPPVPRELSRYALFIQETPDGQVSHSWQPVKDLDLAQYPYWAGASMVEGSIVRTARTRDCEQELDACMDMCVKSLRGRDWSHASRGSKMEICRDRCRPAYNDCNKLQAQAEAQRFPAVDKAVDWLKDNRQELLVGAVVVMAGVAFVVVAAGSGGSAVVLVPALLLVSADSSTEPQIATVRP